MQIILSLMLAALLVFGLGCTTELPKAEKGIKNQNDKLG